ncbi:tRNA-queuosine alpha-mannosyltransferase domain-containing protein [Microbulbifer sp. TRSA005]|uniref:tRNA-queuosine alpha-mannosyltransferase domain-containing protein n=1 Tax=Microbulbifer sp. TRSA005 TaxID=3243383 RepID=UPI0040396218
MKVLLLSAYDADSHKRWRKGLVAAFPEWQWTVLTLPPRYFSWRIRGNSLSWARGEAAQILKQQWDLIVATSMTDLSALRGLVPEIVGVPTVVYFHENQFAYPVSSGAFQSIEPQLLNIYTALAGDLLLFNSEYNRRTLIEGAAKLLKRFPDCVPVGICEEITSKSKVLPVPLEDALFTQEYTQADFCWDHRWGQGYQGEVSKDTLIISWAARWEYDKGADRLLQILRGLKEKKVKFLLNLMGQSFRNSPKEFEQIQREFSENLLVVGYVESESLYRQTLHNSHVFLSTAYHEFQGLAVMEAAVAGCTPLVPDEQCYPEFYPEELRYLGGKDAVAKVDAMVNKVQCMDRLVKVDFQDISWDNYKYKYFCALEGVASNIIG